MSIIDEVKEKIDIVDLVGRDPKIRLRHSGKNWIGFCPFHVNTHTPALVVYPNGTWHCFGVCNDGGTVIDWELRKNAGWDALEAAKHLAEEFNIKVPESAQDLATRTQERVQENVLKLAMGIFQKWLKADADALAYAKDRSWSDDILAVGGMVGFSGRATAAQFNEMRGEFSMHNIDPLSPQAVMVLGYKGDVAAWATAHGIDPKDLPEDNIHGLMGAPGIIYGHKLDGKIEYLSRRNLPGFDGKNGDWKSFNPYEALAGKRKPFFNHLHRFHHTENREKGELFAIVEGQGDCVTTGMWKIPGMALCGASWQMLIDEGIIEKLLSEYENIIYIADADTPGEMVVKGKKNDFPLSAAFGPMLRVARMPRHAWKRPDGRQKKIKDCNDLGQWFADRKIKAKYQAAVVRGVMAAARPIVVEAAQVAGKLQGHYFSGMVRDVILPLVIAMPRDERNHYSEQLAVALYPTKTKAQALAAFRKLTNDEIKEAVKAEKKGEDEDEGEPIYTAGGWIGEWLLELYYDEKERKTFFVTRSPSGKISIMHKCTIEGQVYRPMAVNSLIAKKNVRLPNRLPDNLPSERELVKMISGHQRKYFDFGSNDFFEDLSPLYILHTYQYDAFSEVSYLRALGDYGTGKTRFLKTIGLMCYRPIYVTGGSSPASLYHMIDTYKGTVVLNEADFDNSDEASIIAKILNGGTERDEAITKMKKDGAGNMDIESYNVFSPKVIATRKTFNDRAISSRCLTMEMVPMAPRPDIPQSLPTYFESEHQEIRNYLTLFRLQNAHPNMEINQALTDRSLEPRLNQITLALLTSIKDADMRTQIQRFLREYNQQEKSDRYDTMTARVLEGIVRAWAWGPVSERDGDKSRIYMKDIAHATNLLTDEMNRRLGDKREEDDEDDDGKDGKDKYKKKDGGARMTSRKASETMKKFLQLRTFRATDGLDDYKGTKYVDMAKDELRIRALCERWGVDWKEQNSMQRPVIVFARQPGNELSEDEKSGKAFADERAKWDALQKKNQEESRKVHDEQTEAWQAKRMEFAGVTDAPEDPPEWQNAYP